MAPAPISNRYAEAFTYALELHRDQFRKGTDIPYVAHLIAVSGLVLEYGGTEDEAIAALLHDAVEDQGGPPTLAEIKRRFGDEVAAIVDGCSDTDVTPKPPWQKRKEDYNVRSILGDYRVVGEEVWSRFSGGKDGTLWYYRALVDAYRFASGEPTQASLVAELDRVVSDLEAVTAPRVSSGHPVA